MFNFIKAKLFKNNLSSSKKIRKERREPNYNRKSQRVGGISYDPDLIASLKRDHRLLLDIYQRIWSEGYKTKNYPKLVSQIVRFKVRFQAHLLKENVKFYVYLEQKLSDDDHSLQVIKDFRRDMNSIAIAVVSFCKRYSDVKYTSNSIERFSVDYKNIGEALITRIQLEEKDLYTLYR